MRCSEPFIVAKDTKHGLVLLGGLGAQGVGQMTSEAADHHKGYAGYVEAPEQDLRGTFGTVEFREKMMAGRLGMADMRIPIGNALREVEVMRKGEGETN